MTTHSMDPRLAETIALDQQYYFNVFGERTPLMFTHGEGSWLYTTDGKRYLDMLGGIAVNVLGHANPALTEAIQTAAGKLLHVSNLYYIEQQSRLAQALCQATSMDKAFFCNSGAEANEAAFKLVRAYFHKQGKPRPRILSAKQSFHGRTLATVTATGQPKYNQTFAPLPPGFDYVAFNDIEAMEAAIGSDVAAVILELIQGESGVHPLSAAYVEAVAALCKKHGALLIVDEIQTGMGRCRAFTAAQAYGVDADIVTLAKGLGGGLPIGAMLATDKIAQAFEPGDHGSTFGGNPLVCSAALAVLAEYERLDLTNEAARKGQILQALLGDVVGIEGIRGMGLMVGFDLVKEEASSCKTKLREAGILVGSVGDRSIRLLPPLTVSVEELKHFVVQLKCILAEG